MKITSQTTWSVCKDGLTLDLTVEDIKRLFEQLAWSNHILLFDEASGRCGESIDEMGISLNGSALQITLFKEETNDLVQHLN
jgi:hypothetical protein